MRFVTICLEEQEVVVVVTSKGALPILCINQWKSTAWKTELYDLICAEQIPGLTIWYDVGGKEELESIPGLVPADQVVHAPLYRNPPRIFGIGLNYVDHTGDLGENAPVGFPGSFYKSASRIVDPGDDMCTPVLPETQKTTGEVEFGIILGKKCKFIDEEHWMGYIVSYTTILDMIEESILRQNPRFLTLAKGFDIPPSFGPQLVTSDKADDALQLEAQTAHNGEVHAKNIVNNMTHKLVHLVSLVSHLQGWLPGDIFLAGAPRAVYIEDGDITECRIYGPNGFFMEPLINPVVDLKLHQPE